MSNWDEGNWDSGSWDSDPPATFPTKPLKKRKTNRKTMASNPTPEDDDVLQALAEDNADGCHLHEVSIGIKQNTEAAIRAAITGVNNAKLALAGLKMIYEEKSDDVKTTDEAGKVVIGNCRRRLSKLYGERFNSGWEAAGFPDESTAVPKTPDKRFTLLGKLAAYFTLTPASESADMEATAAICSAAHAATSNARQAQNTASTNQKDGLKTRDAAVKALRNRVRGLIEELEKLIADDDTRWEAFGLNIPANPSAPEGIATLTATAVGGGKIHVVWAYATRMTSTRLLTKRTTGAVIDDDFISAGTTAGLEKTLEDFVPGVIVEVKAVPYNDGGDGPESPTGTVTVG